MRSSAPISGGPSGSRSASPSVRRSCSMYRQITLPLVVTRLGRGRPLVARQAVVGKLVPVALLAGEPVAGDVQPGLAVQRPCRDRDVVAPRRVPEQAGA